MKKLVSTLALSLLFLTGCNTLMVQTDYDTEYNFSALKTYAWLEGSPPSDDIRINNSLTIKRVVNAANSALQTKGYTLTDKDKADFYVTWFGGIETRIQQEGINTYYGHLGYNSPTLSHYGYWPGFSRTYIYEYLEGTLIIDISDSKSKQLVWRGTGQDYVEESATPGEIVENINKAVAEILGGFPP